MEKPIASIAPMSNNVDLTLAPPILFFFGLSGAGKSFVGDLVGELTGRYVYHADEDLTHEMTCALESEQPFSDAMRDDFFSVVAEKILFLHQKFGAIVVTQGAYKQRHRDYLKRQVLLMEMLWIDASERCILQRLATRSRGISPDAAKALIADFEKPNSAVKVINNDGGVSCVVDQFNRYFPGSI